ncbi:MAG: DUF541 domain-containing protein [Acidobacteria bacterium ACB1]|nr:hypothetical protein [Pyrinomonadaceae bacterium]MCE7961076.1 DUF541 domain-containing protein [Acidobacteria bacterium ACB1]RIJ90088.1 MAG: hypothetical protein DCC44_11135 [Acidobacteriota bacterium]
MRRSILSLTILAAFCCFAAAAPVLAQREQPTVEVTGKAEIAVEPDSATITVDFTKLDKSLEVARKASDEGVAKMLKVAKKYDIGGSDIRTRNISVEMKYISIRDANKRIFNDDDDEIGTKQFLGYEVSRTVTIRLTKLDAFDRLFNDILETNPTSISNVSFETSQAIELRTKAREAAMKAAYEKAQAMAGAIGQTIGKAISIKEGSGSDSIQWQSAGSNSNVRIISLPTSSTVASEKLGMFSAGTISVDSSVTVVFLLN